MLVKVSVLCVLLCMLSCLMGSDLQQAGIMLRGIDTPQSDIILQHRTAPSYTFSKLPQSLMVSYNDYMIGSYHGLPLRLVPDSMGGGYFMTYHGQRTATGTRRVFSAYLDEMCNIVTNGEITLSNVREGFPTLAVDPVSGKPFYAWHSNIDADAQLEVCGITDAFIDGISLLWNDPQTIVNNPITLGLTTDNEFLWPTAIIGPSPIVGKRRIYVVSTNSTSHALNTSPLESPFIVYADFDAEDIENGIPLVWSSTSIPTLNQWNTDTTTYRRPSMNIACDNAGNLYYFGYHSASDADDAPINEPDVDVFKCPAYGAGVWQRLTFSSSIPTWNPTDSQWGQGYFVDPDTNLPYTNTQLNWQIENSSHTNATVDNNGRIHIPGLWSINTPNDTYYPEMQFVKEMVFDPVNSTLSINDVYPQREIDDTFNQTFCPWDMEAPWGVVDEYIVDNNGNTHPMMYSDWNFPYWNEQSHDNAMMYHCSNMKITESNEQGMMAIVWQNSKRARYDNQQQDGEYLMYSNTPEIFISVSSDNGQHWSDPIVINNQETSAFAGLIPMWVYPADKVKFVGLQGIDKIGKLGLMFYDDNTWGSNSHSPTEFPNDGGRVMFCELQINFNGYTQPNQQYVGLNNGWNWVSFNRLHSNSQISNVFEDCLENIDIIKNPDGTYIPNNPFSTLHQIDWRKGYYVRTNGSCGVYADGAAIDPGVPIPLHSGWNLCAYTPQSAQPVASALSSISGALLQVKGTQGIYIPGSPLSTLTTLSPGSAYWIQTASDCSLIYNTSGKAAEQPILPSSDIWGSPIVKSDSETLFLSIEGSANAGDIIAAFVGDELRGLGTIHTVEGKQAVLLQVFCDVSGEPLNLKLFSPSDNQLYNLEPQLHTSPGATLGNGESGEYISLKMGSSETPVLSTAMISAYPNPFREGTSIALEIAKANLPIGVDIYNLRGQKVRSVFQGTASTGKLVLNWDSRDDHGNMVSSGLYFCRLSGNGISQSMKLMVLK